MRRTARPLPHGALLPRRAPLRLGLLGLLGLLLLACNPGPYPSDVYPEMHYAPSQRREQPPRLSPPRDAVPVTGARPAYTFDQASRLSNPIPPDADALQRGQAAYRVNCSMCHGPAGQGDGPVAAAFQQAGAEPPTPLASPRVRQRSDGQLVWIIANGLGGMPAFGDLLSEDDLWRVVLVIRDWQR